MNVRRTTTVVAVTAALAWLVGMAWGVRSQASGRLSDFAAFYAGGRLVGTGQLYDTRQLQRIEEEYTGRRSPAHGFVRPPFHALLFWPLARLPYETAEMLWAALTGLALFAFVQLWPSLDLTRRWIVVCLSLPAAIGFANGQDSPLILLAVTFAVALHRNNRPLMAGVVFSLCAAKVHLFLLLPVLVIRRREYRFGSGLLTGGAVLFAISTMAEGWHWPMQMWNAATDPAFTPSPSLMPNLAGALHGVSAAGWIYAVVASVLCVALWRDLAGAPFPAALAATIAASLPLAPHSYLPDCVLMLPAVCVALSHQDLRMRVIGSMLATPFPYVALFLDRPYSALTVLAMLVFAALGGMRSTAT
jgi:hypothetical protein